jgi:hypothetical protein
MLEKYLSITSQDGDAKPNVSIGYLQVSGNNSVTHQNKST